MNFATTLTSLSNVHPFSASIDPVAVESEFHRHQKAMETNPADFDDQTFESQVAQAIDRSLILSGITATRHAPVSYPVKPNALVKSVALAFALKPAMRRAGLNQPQQLARLSMAMSETLALATSKMPGLADDKRNQKASGILFEEVMQAVESSRLDIPSMSDAELLELSQRCFNAKSAKINREIKS